MADLAWHDRYFTNQSLIYTSTRRLRSLFHSLHNPSKQTYISISPLVKILLCAKSYKAVTLNSISYTRQIFYVVDLIINKNYIPCVSQVSITSSSAKLIYHSTYETSSLISTYFYICIVLFNISELQNLIKCLRIGWRQLGQMFIATSTHFQLELN